MIKTLKYFLGITILIIVLAACKKEISDDLSLVQSGTTPDKLSALFTITQDNSGLVTIIPNGEGGATYDVYYGDATTTPATVLAGKNAEHKYKEGVYNVKIIARSVTGKTTEFTKQLTVTFKAPENLEVTAEKDAADKFKVNVSAKALYETFFQVYFGDVANEVPQSFNEGQTISHTYTVAGTYTVKVVALSGGAATTQFSKVFVIATQINLPVTFDLAGVDYTVTDFGNNVSVDANDPVLASNKVKKTTKPNGAEVWAGTTIGTSLGFSSRIPITATASQMSVRIYSPAAGIKIRLKIEVHTDNTKSVETDALTTVANTWETLIFDFSNQATGTATLNTSYFYDMASLFFDFGTVGNGKVFYWDDVKYLNVNVPPTGVSLPLDFQSTTLTYAFTDFGGGNASVINNPQVSGINTSSKVGKMVKSAPEVYGGSFITLASPINFSTQKIFKVKVFAPRVGAKLLLKVENLTNGGISYEKEAATTVANAWEELSFDFSAINTANSYQKVVLIFDLGTAGDGSANFTYLFDDIRLTTVAPAVLQLPLDFESSTLAYNFVDFGGGNTTVVNNPQSSGINTSSKVGKMVKSAPEVYGGSFIALANPIDFSTKKTFKIKVFSPRAGAKLLLKVENLTNGGISYEKEVATTTANAWEVLTFDFSAINTANSYQKVVLIFDLGTVGDGSANFTYLFDDISLN